MQPFELHWEAPEFEYREKTARWYWTSIFVAVLALGAAIWQRNFLFAVFIMVAEVLVLVWSSRLPESATFHLTERGLTVNNRSFYPFAEMENFSVENIELAAWHAVAFRHRRRFRPPLVIPVPAEHLPDVQGALQQTLAEVPWESSVIDSLEKLVRF